MHHTSLSPSPPPLLSPSLSVNLSLSRTSPFFLPLFLFLSLFLSFFLSYWASGGDDCSREDDRHCSARHNKGVGLPTGNKAGIVVAQPRFLACLVARCAGVGRSISHILYVCTTFFYSQPCHNGYFFEFHIKQLFLSGASSRSDLPATDLSLNPSYVFTQMILAAIEKKRNKTPMEVLEEPKGGRPALISQENLGEIKAWAVAQDKKQSSTTRCSRSCASRRMRPLAIRTWCSFRPRAPSTRFESSSYQ